MTNVVQIKKLSVKTAFFVLRRPDSNERPLGYEPNELPLLHSAMFWTAKVMQFFESPNLFDNYFHKTKDLSLITYHSSLITKRRPNRASLHFFAIRY